ncbi:hypothetical protein RDWZM_005884 [Blomia tropicalis]|uniref:G-protein coupled receptors family 1 profile domain-containing protein n=1 Tax=Blomia tropicalis TaxID=40697 RepID=A0A9Q0M6U4_BLOTA|nr:hypothetical protein RDWZM_005884 [Blomia tropicalis]
MKQSTYNNEHICDFELFNPNKNDRSLMEVSDRSEYSETSTNDDDDDFHIFSIFQAMYNISIDSQPFSSINLNHSETHEVLFNETLSNYSMIQQSNGEVSMDRERLIASFEEFLSKLDPRRDNDLYNRIVLRNLITVCAYLIIILVSLFGNLLVLFIILSKRHLRASTTNKLIANLTFSDLLLTMLNIPLTIVRISFDSWPLGSALCYLGPLVQVICYTQIGIHIWKRVRIGAMTRSQKFTHLQARKRTIKMLVLVVIVFAICWLPLNLYHITQDFLPNVQLHYSKSIFTFCHWFGISSVAVNPFVYFWLNKQYKQRARNLLRICFDWQCCPTTSRCEFECELNDTCSTYEQGPLRGLKTNRQTISLRNMNNAQINEAKPCSSIEMADNCRL